MVQSAVLINGLGGKIGAQLLEHIFVHGGQDNGRMYLAALEFVKLFKGESCLGVIGGTDSQSYEHLIGMQAGVSAAKMLSFKILYRRKSLGQNQLYAVIDICKLL